jgi:hypothetical protein
MGNTPNCGPTAGARGEPDPIFAAIERHRAAFQIWRAAYDRLGALQDRWEFGEIPPHYTDAHEWIEANTAYVAAVEEVAKALEILLSTPPTTIAGVADLLDYVGRYECHPVVGTTNYEPVFEKSYLGVQNSPANFLPVIAATLPRRATGEPDVIFAAIERHRAAVRGWLAAIERRWEFYDDAPEWIEANTAFFAAAKELDKALEAVLSTPPTTIAGVADLLDYVGREEWEVAGADEWADDLDGTILENAFVGDHGLGFVENPACIDEGVLKAAPNFLPMIAASLRSLTAESTSRRHGDPMRPGRSRNEPEKDGYFYGRGSGDDKFMAATGRQD